MTEEPFSILHGLENVEYFDRLGTKLASDLTFAYPFDFNAS
jgi:hypothetical protein